LFSLFVSSLVLGIAFCAPPGIVAAETVRRGLARGYGPALLVQLGSLVGDATWAILALTSAAFLVQSNLIRWVLGVFGTILLLWLSWCAYRDALKGSFLESRLASGKNDFVTGIMLSLSNPFAIAFWLGVGTSTVSMIVPEPEFVHFALFFFAFMLGALVYSFFMAGLVSKGKSLVRDNLFRWVNLACGLFLSFFAFQLAWKLVQSLLE